jgi:hypothetical protein
MVGFHDHLKMVNAENLWKNYARNRRGLKITAFHLDIY